MHILAAADIHGVLPIYEWLGQIVRAQRAEVLILAGDLFAGLWQEEQRQQAPQIIALLKEIPVPVFYLMGNDDFVGLEYEDEHIKSLHVRRFELGEYNLVGYQYSLPFVGGIYEKPESEIEKDACSLEPLLDAQTIFVTHSPAFRILDRVYSGDHVGSRSLAALLERKPVLAHIHGHIHESFGRQGNHFNVAAAGRHRAVLIELPGLSHTVVERR